VNDYDYAKAPLALRAFLIFVLAMNLVLFMVMMIAGQSLGIVNLVLAAYLWFSSTGLVIRKGRFW